MVASRGSSDEAVSLTWPVFIGVFGSLFVSPMERPGHDPNLQTVLAVVCFGGINRGGRHSSYSTNIRVFVGARALVSGAPLPNKTGHSCRNNPAAHDEAFKHGPPADDADFLVIDLDLVNHGPDIGPAEWRFAGQDVRSHERVDDNHIERRAARGREIEKALQLRPPVIHAARAGLHELGGDLPAARGAEGNCLPALVGDGEIGLSLAAGRDAKIKRRALCIRRFFDFQLAGGGHGGNPD